MGRSTILLVLVALLILGGLGGVVYLGKVAAPPSQEMVKVLPDGQFPR